MTELRREIGLWRGTALNMIEMVGIGPFTTIPLILAAMGGGRSMLAWVLGALLAISDGLVTAELAAQMPSSGGSYRFLRDSWGKWGKILSFLFLFQMMISVPLSAASGCIGFSNYAAFFFPDAPHKLVAVGMAALTTVLLLRRIESIGNFSVLLWIGVVATLTIVIGVGLPHLKLEAFEFWKAPRIDGKLGFAGLGTALIFAVYDYLGYYNIANIGDEVKDPVKTVPRVIIISILAIAVIYIVMNACILSVIPVEQAIASKSVVSDYLAILLGPTAAKWLTLLILWTAFASVFSLVLGYSRIIYAAARDGNFFSFFARLHPTGAYPIWAVVLLGAGAAFFCIFDLGTVVKSLITIRAINPFMTQIVGAVILRVREPNRPRPFKMWLYPLPAIMAFSLWMYVLISPEKGFKSQSLILFSVGIAFYFVRETVLRRAVKRV